MDPVQIGRIGELLVARKLSGAGYRTNVDTRGPGSTDIEGSRADRHLLVQVKASVHPALPATLSADEERNIKARAMRLGVEAWEARLWVTAQGTSYGDIAWRKLA